ncbi:MAG: type 1 glutamine amidotransferase [Nocardioidaceae bacterium]
MRKPPVEPAFTVVLVYPELLGTYGDRGNLLALLHRTRARGLSARVVEVSPSEPVPGTADLYLLGGGEDASQLLAWEALRADRGLRKGVSRGAPCLAVCAGFQLLSECFTGPDGVVRPGLGLLDARCGRLPGTRAVGEVVAEADGLPLPLLSGFENHQGDARLGSSARRLGRVVSGTGNGHDAAEGAVQGAVVATYLHGPVLVRNPALADHLVQQATGRELAPLTETAVERLRAERLGRSYRVGAPRPLR